MKTVTHCFSTPAVERSVHGPLRRRVEEGCASQSVVSELVCVRCDRERNLTQHLALADVLEGLYPPLLLWNRRRDDESDIGVAAVIDLGESMA